MSEATELRERAGRCREIAREYHPSVGRPLWAQARELDRQAAQIERRGIERRRYSTGPVRSEAAPAPSTAFGRKGRESVADANLPLRRIFSSLVRPR